jgi:hypothetical protein
MDNSFFASIVTALENQGANRADSLKEKFDYWNTDDRIFKEFYRSLPHRTTIETDITNDPTPDIATELFEEGFIVVSNQWICYDNLNNGESCKLEKTWSENDSICFNKLQAKSLEDGRFRMESITERKTVQFDDHTWLYTKFSSPRNQYGKSMWSDSTDNDSNAGTRIREFIDQVAVLSKEVISISQENNNLVPYHLYSPINVYYDDSGMYFSNLYNWNSSVSDAKANGLSQLKMVIGVASKWSKRIDALTGVSLIDYATEKWA